MRFLHLVLPILATLASTETLAFADRLQVSVRVLDQKDRPARDVLVNSFWRANGTGRTTDDKPLDLSTTKNQKLFWGTVGQMASNAGKKTNVDGTCQLELHSRSRVLYAMSPDRKLGGIGIIPPDYSGQQVKIRLTPVVTVKGQYRPAAPGQRIDWAHTYVELIPDRARPIAVNRFISCGSFERRFEFKVPAGQYRLNAYGISDAKVEDIDLAATKTPTLAIDGRSKVLDIGWIELAPKQSLDGRKQESQKAGRWRDYTKHYGEPAPPWHTSLAKGIGQHANISNFKGKWVVIEFWGFGCAPCIRDELPKLMRFAEAHAGKKDELQIVTVCIDFEGKLKTIKDVEKALAPIEKHVWKGKELTIPIVVDSTFKTWERYGLSGFGTLVLINPEGKLVKGDLTTLEAILRKK